MDSGSPNTITANSLVKKISNEKPKKVENKYVNLNKNGTEFNGTIQVHVNDVNQKKPIIITKKNT